MGLTSNSLRHFLDSLKEEYSAEEAKHLALEIATDYEDRLRFQAQFDMEFMHTYFVNKNRFTKEECMLILTELYSPCVDIAKLKTNFEPSTLDRFVQEQLNKPI